MGTANHSPHSLRQVLEGVCVSGVGLGGGQVSPEVPRCDAVSAQPGDYKQVPAARQWLAALADKYFCYSQLLAAPTRSGTWRVIDVYPPHLLPSPKPSDDWSPHTTGWSEGDRARHLAPNQPNHWHSLADHSPAFSHGSLHFGRHTRATRLQDWHDDGPTLLSQDAINSRRDVRGARPSLRGAATARH